MKLIHIVTVLFVSLVNFYCSTISAQCPEEQILNLRKTALIIGEKDYKNCPPLRNPENDAHDISDSLNKLGFRVTTYYNSDYKTMNDVIDQWIAKLDNYDVALFYFSGHGAEVRGENFLFPTDIDAKSQSDLKIMAYPADNILDALDNAHLKYSIIILDACRNNPFTSGWAKGIGAGGLAQMAGKGAFIAFAATPGETALDGSERNGVYTEGILRNIMSPNKTIADIFTNVNGYVRTVTDGRQKPFFNSSMGMLYCFSIARKRQLVKLPKIQYGYQTGSSIAISADQTTIFTVDEKTHEISLHDVKSMNLLRTLISIPGKPVNLISVANSSLFVTDSTNRVITKVDWQQDKVIQQINLSITPVSTFLSPDEKNLYIFGNDKGHGYFTIVDVINGEVRSSCPLIDQVTSTVCDAKSFYSIPLNETKALLATNIKSGFTKKITLDFIPSYIGVTPDNKKLFLANFSSQRLMKLDISSFKIIDTLNINVKNLKFTNDSNYGFALNDDQAILFRTSDDVLIKKISFFNTPKDMVSDSENGIYIWLPDEEDRVYTLRLDEQLKDSVNNLDPGAKLKAFQAWEHSDPTYQERVQKQNRCNQIHQYSGAIYQKIAYQLIGNVAVELGMDFSVKEGQYPTEDCAKETCVFSKGIQAKDPKKSIFPIFQLTYNGAEVTLSIEDKNIDKAPVTLTKTLLSGQKEFSPFNLPFSLEDSKQLESFVRYYFLDRLDNLK